MKVELKSMARQMSAGKIGTFTTKMVKCFGGDRSGGGVDSFLEINASSNTSATKASAPSGALGAAVTGAAAIEGAGKMLRFVASSSNCIGYSVANLLDGVDVAAADAAANWPARVAFTTKVFMGKGTVDTFIAQLDGVKCKGTSGKKGFYDKNNTDAHLIGLLDWFLSEDVNDNQRGLFIAMVRDDSLAADHCIGIDTKKRIILDPSREHALPLVRSSFDLCVPDGYTCSGIAAARKLLVELPDVAPPVTDAKRRRADDANSTDANSTAFKYRDKSANLSRNFNYY